MKVAVLFLKFLPYHYARISSLARLFEVTGIEVSNVDLEYNWDFGQSDRCDFKTETLFDGVPFQKIPRHKQRERLDFVLNKYMPDAIMIPGWALYFCKAALRWARDNNRAAILMSESKRDDYPRLFLKEWMTARIVSRFRGAIVAGTPHRDYLIRLGMAENKIVLGYDVVDNSYIAALVERHRKASKNPVAGKYFLSVSRFIKRKNLSRLIDAYALYRKNSDRTAWGLVLCGCGPEESSLRRRVKEGNISGVIFTGALKPDELCRYLAFAEAYVHPAYSEQWGLSVNEAMAAGKPILISSTCGCRYDLVKDGENGILFDPYNIAQLSVLMSGLAKGEYDLSRMGKASREIIGQWGPELFANSTRLLIDKII